MRVHPKYIFGDSAFNCIIIWFLIGLLKIVIMLIIHSTYIANGNSVFESLELK